MQRYQLIDRFKSLFNIYALSVLLFALTVLRIGSVLLYQREVAARGVSATEH